MPPKLILIEGLPGTGKSTTAQWLAEQHRLNQISAKWHYEISASNPLIAGQQPAAQLPTESLFGHGLKTWARCVKHVQDAPEVVILDAGLFQHVTMQAFRRGCSDHEIKNYLTQVENIILPLQPLIIYTSPDDVAQHVEQMYMRRGERFKELIVKWCSDSADANRKGYRGYDGSIRFWCDFDDLCKGFIVRMQAKGIRLGMTAAKPNWLEHQKEILGQLEIKPLAVTEPDDPSRFVGAYLQRETGKEFTIRSENGELRAKGILEPLEQDSVLISSKKNDCLLIRGHDAVLEFVDDKVLVHSGWQRINGCVFTVSA